MASALTAKLVSLTIAWIISIVLGSLPYFILKKRVNGQNLGERGDFILSILNAFSGGIFLGTCFLHLMEEGRQELTKAFEMYQLQHVTYPVFAVLVVGGFFAIVFVDFVANLCLLKSTVRVVENKIGISTNDADINVANQASSESFSVNRQAYGSITESQVTQSTETPPSTTVKKRENRMILDESKVIQISPNNGSHQENTSIAPFHSHQNHKTQGHVREDSIHSHGHGLEQLSNTSTVRAIILLIALSFHTIFDGLAIGLQEFEKDVWQVLAAISVHKALVSFCLGLQLFKAYEQRLRTAAILVVLFTFISPIGISIGIVVTSANIDEDAQTMASAVLQGIASGTFLYVTFFEILKEAFSHGKGIWNILVACVGFAAMAAVKLLQ